MAAVGKMLGYDLSSDGHHHLYNLTVMQHLKEQGKFEHLGYYTLNGKEEMVRELKGEGIRVVNLPPFRKAGRLGIWRRTLCLLGMLIYARRHGYGKVHLFHLDSTIAPLLLVLPLLAGLRVTGTLHWYPNRPLKRRILLLLLRIRALDKVVVHGNYTQEKLIRDGCGEKKVANIHIPFFRRSGEGGSAHLAEARSRLAARPRPYLLCFGGMRYDKGIDLLMQALAAVRDKEFTVIVAGSEDRFTEKDLDKWEREYRLEGRICKDIRYIPESVKNYYLEQCDAVVLPYRAMFSGISGLLTEGAASRKFVLGPNHGEIGYTIETYGLGETFEAENTADLAVKLRKLLNRLSQGRGSLQAPPGPASLYARYLRDEKLFGEKYGDFLASS